MAKSPKKKPAPRKAATRNKKAATARAAKGATAAETAAPSPDAVAVGEVIDGWTVVAINNPTDVQIAQGAERRSVTVADLVRAKQTAGTQL